tara:strand:- start:798 stop:1202 length:405 start_codon:yes stop_codon:yes gene_type:complete
MTFTLTTDETKVVKSGSVDFSKFVDYESGNINPMYFTFTAQQVLDQNFTSDQAKIIINSLISKGVLNNNILFDVTENGSNYIIKIVKTNPDITAEIASEQDTYLNSCVSSLTKIDNKWMFVLSDEYIKYIALQS